MLCNSYQSRNLIGPYCFWGISPRNSTLFTRLFLARRHTWAVHKTKYSLCLVLHLTLTKKKTTLSVSDSLEPRSSSSPYLFGRRAGFKTIFKKEPGNHYDTWNVYMTVPGRNQTLFRCVFQPRCRVRSSTSVKGGAHMRYVDLSGIHVSSLCVWAPPLMEVLHHSTSNTATRLKYTVE